MIDHRRFGAWQRRLLWLMIVVVSCIGLRNYRIDNDISRWTPELTDSVAGASFVMIGFEPDTVDARALTARLGDYASVRGVQPIIGDGSMNGLLVYSWPNSGNSTLTHDTREALGADIDQVALAGPTVFREALDDWSQRGLPIASGLTLVLGALVLALTTRRIRPVVESLIAVFTSQMVLIGIISILKIPMDMVLSMLPPLLMGLGFSFAAHRATRNNVNRALILSACTTGIALATFVFTNFQPIRSFAVWGALGIMLTWVAVMLLVTPSVERAVRRPTKPHHSAQRPPHLALIIVSLGVLISLAGIACLPRLSLQEDTIAYFPDDARIATDYRQLDRELTGTLPFHVTIEDPNADATAMLMATEGVRRVVRTPSVDGATSAIYFGLASNGAVPALARAQPNWQEWATAHGTSLRWGGVAAQVDFIGQTVWRTATWALPTMLLVAGCAAFLVDRRWSSAVLSIWINGFPIAVLSLVLTVRGDPVGLPTLIISALAVGVAIDDTLHVLIARRRLDSWARAFRACRAPCVGSSVAMAACMLTFAICPFRPTAEFGVLMATAVLAALVGDMVLMPAVARLFRMRDTR